MKINYVLGGVSHDYRSQQGVKNNFKNRFNSFDSNNIWKWNIICKVFLRNLYIHWIFVKSVFIKYISFPKFSRTHRQKLRLYKRVFNLMIVLVQTLLIMWNKEIENTKNNFLWFCAFSFNGCLQFVDTTCQVFPSKTSSGARYCGRIGHSAEPLHAIHLFGKR